MSANMVDTIRALFTYVTALLIAVGGLTALVLVSGMAPDTKTIVGAFVGSALTFLFGQEVQTRTARQAAASTLAANTTTNGNGHS